MLSACNTAPNEGTPRTSSTKSDLTLMLGAKALLPRPASTEISFGRYLPGVLPSVSRILGEQPALLPCARNARLTVAQYPSGLSLAFRDRHLSGWFLSTPGLRTTSGHQVGDVAPPQPVDGIVMSTLQPPPGARDPAVRIGYMTSSPEWISGQDCPSR